MGVGSGVAVGVGEGLGVAVATVIVAVDASVGSIPGVLFAWEHPTMSTKEINRAKTLER